MNLQPISFADVTEIQHAFFLETTGRSRLEYALIAQFRGVYRTGSEGASDAAYLFGMLNAALEIWTPGQRILDFSELDYQSGDEMDRFTGPFFGDRPFALIVGPKCRRGIATLCFRFGREDMPVPDATTKPWIFDGLNDALSYVRDSEAYAALKDEVAMQIALQRAALAARQESRSGPTPLER